MNPSVNKPSILKIAAGSACCMLFTDVVIDLFATHFKPVLLWHMLSWEYFAYNLIPELLVTFLCAAGTILITSKLKDFTWKSVVLRVLVFASVYAALCMLISLILFMALNGINWKLYNPVDYLFFITGIRVAFYFPGCLVGVEVPAKYPILIQHLRMLSVIPQYYGHVQINTHITSSTSRLSLLLTEHKKAPLESKKWPKTA